MENLCNNCIHKDVCSRWTATWGMKSCEHYMTNYMAKGLEVIPALVQAVIDAMPDLIDTVAEKVGDRFYADMRGKEDG